MPESYFKLKSRISREKGLGDKEFTQAEHEDEIIKIRATQRASLQAWAKYLSAPENRTLYDNWFRVFAWDGIRKLGAYDKEKKQFAIRDARTTAAFPELNSEALSNVYGWINNYALAKEAPENVDEQVRNLVKMGSFRRLYEYAVEQTQARSEIRRQITKGCWKKFSKIVDEEVHIAPKGAGGATSMAAHQRAIELAASLKGYGTGWCTSSSGTADEQLRIGDVYVYYSEDKTGQAVFPRLAIRMDGHSEVTEVRGINPNQNIEACMLDIVNEKLRTLPGGSEYDKKIATMEWVTDIEKKVHNGLAIDTDDLFSLYYGELMGFGYDTDPRIDQMLVGRDPVKDLAMFIETLGVNEVIERLDDSERALNIIPYAGVLSLEDRKKLFIHIVEHVGVIPIVVEGVCSLPAHAMDDVIADVIADPSKVNEAEVLVALILRRNGSLSGSTTERVLDSGNRQMILRIVNNIQCFPDLTHDSLALRLMKSGDIILLAKCIDRLTNISRRVEDEFYINFFMIRDGDSREEAEQSLARLRSKYPDGFINPSD